MVCITWASCLDLPSRFPYLWNGWWLWKIMMKENTFLRDVWKWLNEMLFVMCLAHSGNSLSFAIHFVSHYSSPSFPVLLSEGWGFHQWFAPFFRNDFFSKLWGSQEIHNPGAKHIHQDSSMWVMDFLSRTCAWWVHFSIFLIPCH